MNDAKGSTVAHRGLTIGIIACAVVAVVGIALWMVQLSGGMIQTGMRNLDSWGFYITLFMFFVGLSAGGLIISSIPNAFGMKGFGDISRVAIWTSICCTCVAIGFVVVDLGGPLRLWELFVYSNLSSPLMWDIIVLSTYLILSIVYLWAYRREDEGKMSHTAIRVISIIALVVAVGVHTVTAWIFSLSAAHEFWHTALMGPWFVASALDCGTALVLVVVIALQKAGRLSIERSSMVNLAKMLAVFTCVDLYFFACDLLTSGFPGGEGADVVAMLVTGPLAPFFWTQIACMVLACVILFSICFSVVLFFVRRKHYTLEPGPLPFSRAEKAHACFTSPWVWVLLVGGFQIPNIEFADVANQMTITHWDSGMSLLGYQGLVYWPTPLEFGVAAGVVALGGFLLLLGLKYLPLHLKEKAA